MPSLIKSHPSQTILEEIFNASTHGLGVLLSVSALIILVVISAIEGQAAKVVSSAVYGTTLVLMYTASTVYHMVQKPRAKQILQVLDHSSIYLLIAGSYTPFTLVSLPDDWGWTLFGIIWGLAAAGVVFKMFFTGRLEFLSVTIYLLMGWLIVIAFEPLLHSLPHKGIVWLVSGGLCYTLGIIFYIVDGRYHLSHFLWHLAVLAGSICQFFAVLYYVL